jgi:hypothetical protein
MKRLNPKQGAILLLILVVFFVADYLKKDKGEGPGKTSSLQLEEAYKNRQKGVQVKGSGTVIKILADDLQGSRHQKFILRVTDNLTVLISHNIDLAPRINSLVKGETLSFFGEYEWNPKGGLVHWTHHDPHKRHPDGWLKYRGKVYQ